MPLTKDQMIQIENYTINDLGIPSILLMELAGHQVYDHIKDHKAYTIVCGGGNNGGDGLVLARHLILNQKTVQVFIIKDARTEDAKTNLAILENLTDHIYYIKEKSDLGSLEESIQSSQVLVDAVFGIGLSRDVEGIYKDVIETINQNDTRTISIDIPSGLDADTGAPLGLAVKADETIAIHKTKVGQVRSSYSGKIVEKYVGIAQEKL